MSIETTEHRLFNGITKDEGALISRIACCNWDQGLSTTDVRVHQPLNKESHRSRAHRQVEVRKKITCRSTLLPYIPTLPWRGLHENWQRRSTSPDPTGRHCAKARSEAALHRAQNFLSRKKSPPAKSCVKEKGRRSVPVSSKRLCQEVVSHRKHHHKIFSITRSGSWTVGVLV